MNTSTFVPPILQQDRHCPTQTTEQPRALASTPRLVKMRGYGLGERSTLGISIATAAGLLTLWWLVSRLGWVSPLFLPTPSEVLDMAWSIWKDGYANATLWEHVSASLTRILSAAAIAIALGIPVGLAMGLNRWAKGIFDAPIGFYWPLPPLAYLPLMIIWLGIGETSKIALLALAMFAPICLSAQAGVRGVPMERVNAALSLGATRWQLFSKVQLQMALPQVFAGLRIAMTTPHSPASEPRSMSESSTARSRCSARAGRLPARSRAP